MQPSAAAGEGPERLSREAPLGRRLCALLYEALLLFAVLWCAGLIYQLVESLLDLAHRRALHQLYLVTFAGLYFGWQWVRGQTLAMKTWRLRLVAGSHAPVTKRQAAIRYFAALGGSFALGLGFLWALVDRDRRFLHDRLAGTRILEIPRETP